MAHFSHHECSNDSTIFYKLSWLSQIGRKEDNHISDGKGNFHDTRWRNNILQSSENEDGIPYAWSMTSEDDRWLRIGC